MNKLIPAFTDELWTKFQPEGGRKNADFEISSDGSRASIKTVPDYGVGKYLITVPVKGGAFYDFSVACKTPLADCDVYVILTQYRATGSMPIREHCKYVLRDGEHLRFSDKLDIDKTTAKLEIELWVKGENSFGEWEVPTLTECEPIPERIVRMAAVQMKWPSDAPKTEENHFNAYMDSIDKLGKTGVDLVVFGECMYCRGLGLPDSERVAFERKMMAALANKAIEHNTNIIYNGVEEENGLYYNTSFVYNRRGELVGKYRKTHLTVGEIEEGTIPGKELPVFDLDFGRIGCLICYDQFFPEAAKVLARRGAEIICIPTAGDDSHACMALAMDCGVYLAVAGMNNENEFGWGATRIVDPLGKLLDHTDEHLGAARATVDLNKKVRRFWMSTGPAASEVWGDYRYEINPHCFE